MRMSDWSSDVCSSDLSVLARGGRAVYGRDRDARRQSKQGENGARGGGGKEQAMMGHPPEALTLHEKRVDAMLQLIAGSGGACATAHRRAQARLSGQDYDAEAYYDRWLIAFRDSTPVACFLAAAGCVRPVAARPT